MKRLVVVVFALAVSSTLGARENAASVTVAEPVTFNNQVVRILQKRCQVCHHDGDIAPFSLVTYNQTKLFGIALPQVLDSRSMPPWKPASDCGEFQGDRRLSDEEIDLIEDWVASGMAEGNPADLPPPLQFSNDWPLGTPDVILQPDASFEVGLGEDIYRYFSFPTDLRADRFLSAIDVKPLARSIVHHATIYLDETGVSKRADDNDPGPGFASSGLAEFLTKGAIGWWAPGEQARFEPSGTAWRLPKDARIVLKIHYHVHHGTGGTDRTQVGLYFARTPVTKELRVLPVVNTDFAIPPGEDYFHVTASARTPVQNVHALGIAAHMQILGTDMEVETAEIDGLMRCLISLDDWDSHWQSLYIFKEPVPLPGSTLVGVSAHYNNSTSNPENPNFPPKLVRYGESTTDETCAAFIKYTLDVENRSLSSPQLIDASIDSSDQLIVRGKGFLEGADIEVDGRRVADTRNPKKKAQKRLLSSSDWRTLIPAGKQVMITVLNPDGVRSSAIGFAR